MTGWYYIQKGMIEDKTIGPISDNDFLELAFHDSLALETLVSHTVHTKGQWVKAERIPAFIKRWQEGEILREQKVETAKAEKERKRKERAEERERARQQKREEEARRRAQYQKRRQEQADEPLEAEVVEQYRPPRQQSPVAPRDPSSLTKGISVGISVALGLLGVPILLCGGCIFLAALAPSDSYTSPSRVRPKPGTRVERSITTTTSEAWYSGGTLHNKTVSEWRNASHSNRLATCADFVMALGDYESLPPDLRQRATELERCISVAVDGENVDHQDVASIAATCAVLLGY